MNREKLIDDMLDALEQRWRHRRDEQHARVAMSAALAVAEADFNLRETHEPIGCPLPGACSCLRSEAAIRADEREACAKVADQGGLASGERIAQRIRNRT